MKILKCLLIDDSIEVTNNIKSILEKYTFLTIISVNSYKSAYEYLKKEEFDFLLLDIHLGDDSGLNLVNSLSSIPPIIIISSSPDYAVETYKIDKVVDYVLKPVNESRLLKAIGRVVTIINPGNTDEERDHCFMKVSRKATRFDFETIDYIEAVGMNSKVYCNGHFKLANESLSNLEQLLPSSFKRVHKSFIVNLNKITSISIKSIEIENNKIPIGASYRPKLMNLLKMFNIG